MKTYISEVTRLDGKVFRVGDEINIETLKGKIERFEWFCDKNVGVSECDAYINGNSFSINEI